MLMQWCYNVDTKTQQCQQNMHDDTASCTATHRVCLQTHLQVEERAHGWTAALRLTALPAQEHLLHSCRLV